MASVNNTINKKTKNSLPTFTRGTLEELEYAIQQDLISAPALHFLTDIDKQCLAFVDIDKKIYQINLSRIEKLEQALDDMKTPEGELIPISDYVEQSVEPIQEQVTTIEEKVGNVYMILGGDV